MSCIVWLPVIDLSYNVQTTTTSRYLIIRCLYRCHKGEPSHPTEETHFGRLYPRSHSFNHYPKLMTIAEGWNVDWLINRKLCLPAQLSLHHNGLVQRLHYCCTNPSVHLTLHFALTLRYLNFFAWGRNSKKKTVAPKIRSKPEGTGCLPQNPKTLEEPARLRLAESVTSFES